jgi:hypothetical protein
MKKRGVLDNQPFIYPAQTHILVNNIAQIVFVCFVFGAE